MGAEIRTLKDGETTVYPRTLASAVQNSDGTTIDITIQKAVENTTQLTGNIDTVLENVLTGESVTSLNSELDNINGEVVGTDTTAKLDKIESTKAAISQAISDKGVDMSDVTVFGDYAGKIGEIDIEKNELVEIQFKQTSFNPYIYWCIYLSAEGVFKTEIIGSSYGENKNFTAKKNSIACVYSTRDSSNPLPSEIKSGRIISSIEPNNQTIYTPSFTYGNENTPSVTAIEYINFIILSDNIIINV